VSIHLGPDDNLAAVVRQLLADGREVAVVPAGVDRLSTYDAFAATLDLPQWFGRNADALYDCLRDWAWAGERPRALVLDGVAQWAATDPAGVSLVDAVLTDLEAEDVIVVTVTR
jgi:hypothetical protein